MEPLKTPPQLRKRPMTRPTIRDVARASGVATSTVSRIMNFPPAEFKVSAQTRQRVTDAMARLGYRPSWRARVFANRRTKVIGLFNRHPSLSGRGAVWQGLVSGLNNHLHELGYETQFAAMEGLFGGDTQAILDSRFDGCIIFFDELTAAMDESLYQTRMPAVLLHTRGMATRPTVMADELDGSRQLTRHLLELGHRRIAYLDPHTSPSERDKAHYSVADRLRGFRETMAEAGLAASAHVFLGDEAALDDALSLPEPPTALISAVDHAALRLNHACWRRGIRIPSDISLATFNDSPITEFLTPPLTTIALPVDQMAAQAIRLLMAQIEHPDAMLSEQVVLPETLIVRESTAAVAGAGSG